MAPGTPGTRAGPSPRDVTEYDDISSIPFSFSRHPASPDAHIHMNSIYGDAFMRMGELFVVEDPPIRTTFVTDPIAIIKDRIREDSIVPNAADITDPTSITPLWARCTFSIGVRNRYPVWRLTTLTLKEAQQHAIA